MPKGLYKFQQLFGAWVWSSPPLKNVRYNCNINFIRLPLESMAIILATNMTFITRSKVLRCCFPVPPFSSPSLCVCLPYPSDRAKGESFICHHHHFISTLQALLQKLYTCSVSKSKVHLKFFRIYGVEFNIYTLLHIWISLSSLHCDFSYFRSFGSDLPLYSKSTIPYKNVTIQTLFHSS